MKKNINKLQSKNKSKSRVGIKQKSESKIKLKSGVKDKHESKNKKVISKSKVKSKPKVRTNRKSGDRIKSKSKTKIETNQQKRMSDASMGYLVAGIFEAVMAMPIVGWSMGISSVGFFWVAGLIINIVVLTIVKRSKKSISGNVVGIIANIIGWVPILGWFFHLIATILLFVFFFKEERI